MVGPRLQPDMLAMPPLPILCFSDILCVWAYFAELRLDEARRNFGAQIEFQHRFCQVFGDVPGKMAAGWRDKGEGVAEHVQHVPARFPEAPFIRFVVARLPKIPGSHE